MRGRGWALGEIDALRRLLEKLNTSIEAIEGRPWPRASGGPDME